MYFHFLIKGSAELIINMDKNKKKKVLKYDDEEEETQNDGGMKSSHDVLNDK